MTASETSLEWGAAEPGRWRWASLSTAPLLRYSGDSGAELLPLHALRESPEQEAG